MPKPRKLIWFDGDGNEKIARGTGVEVTASGTVIIFHGDNGDIMLTSGMKFIIL